MIAPLGGRPDTCDLLALGSLVDQLTIAVASERCAAECARSYPFGSSSRAYFLGRKMFWLGEVSRLGLLLRDAVG